MPELAAVFLLGSVLSLVTAGLFTFWQMQHYQSYKFQTLQKNLGKIGLRWNDLNSGAEEISEGREEKEKSRALLTYIIFGIIGVVLSWFGLFLLLMMWVSLKKLVKSRLEERIFDGELVLKDLEAPDVARLWIELSS